jgi:threonine aldolase
LIEEARRARKMLGGGMRQAGIIAAAGLVALERMIDRLAEDHANARYLAEGISRLGTVDIDLGSVQTNIVIFDVDSLGTTAGEFAAMLEEEGLRVTTKGRTKVRCVTHHGIRREDVEEALGILESVIERVAASRSGG